MFWQMSEDSEVAQTINWFGINNVMSRLQCLRNMHQPEWQVEMLVKLVNTAQWTSMNCAQLQQVC